MDDLHPAAVWHALTTLPWLLRLLVVATMLGAAGLSLYGAWWVAAVMRARRLRGGG